MLKLITLFTIDKIFTEQCNGIKLSTTAKILYINCLTHWFKDKEPTSVNNNAFELSINEIPRYKQFEHIFKELETSGLVLIGNEVVLFVYSWGKYIDKSKLDIISPEDWVSDYQPRSADNFKTEILENQSFFEQLQMTHNVTEKDIIEKINQFITDQNNAKNKYPNYKEFHNHFRFWFLKVVPLKNNLIGKRQNVILGD